MPESSIRMVQLKRPLQLLKWRLRMKSWQIISGFQSGPRKRDTRIILVDDDVHQVGDHDEGEIVIAGPSVSKGLYQ